MKRFQFNKNPILNVLLFALLLWPCYLYAQTSQKGSCDPILQRQKYGKLIDRIKELENHLSLLKKLQKHVKITQINGRPAIIIHSGNLYVWRGPKGTAPNGLGNVVIGFNRVRKQFSKGQWVVRTTAKNRTGSHNLVVGNGHHYTSDGGVVLGQNNTVSGSFSTVLGGSFNGALGKGSSVVGGHASHAKGAHSVVVGGQSGGTSGDSAVVVGGYLGNASGKFSTSVGGAHNSASGLKSSVFGGFRGQAKGNDATVCGGDHNQAVGNYSSTFGGHNGKAIAAYSSTHGGYSPTAKGACATTVVGRGNGGRKLCK
ncbi:MAG: hypothetical protein EP343_00600 [Deltaproteobacteria bacterium]|nr:MAG: hypothetical protein EP343_00600 [Deltaproteobacteria bacterium]